MTRSISSLRGEVGLVMARPEMDLLDKAEALLAVFDAAVAAKDGEIQRLQQSLLVATSRAVRPFRAGDRVLHGFTGPGTVVTWSQLWSANGRRPYQVDASRAPVKFDDPEIGFAHTDWAALRRICRVFQDADGYVWDEQADGSVKLRKYRPDVTPNYVLSFDAAHDAYKLTEIDQPDAADATHGGVQ